MEQFVQAITGGGLSLVAGLWLVTLFESGTVPFLFGSILVLLGVGGLTSGIWMGLDSR